MALFFWEKRSHENERKRTTIAVFIVGEILLGKLKKNDRSKFFKIVTNVYDNYVIIKSMKLMEPFVLSSKSN